jgi:hypothetical protein
MPAIKDKNFTDAGRRVWRAIQKLHTAVEDQEMCKNILAGKISKIYCKISLIMTFL